MIRTTDVELKGDRYRANSLAEAHVRRLLHVFRENNSFQNLLINTHKENFFDDTGKYIGTITMTTRHGAEDVIVDVPPVPKPKPEELYEKKEEQNSIVVPLMRSTDNKYWVACLGEGFEGPYVAFENIHEITPEEMSDNEEIELDGRQISSTTVSINGSDGGDLFFISQSGIVPEDEDIELTLDPTYATKSASKKWGEHLWSLWYIQTGPLYCPETGRWQSFLPIDFSYTGTFYRKYTVWGDEISMEQRKFGSGHERHGPGIGSSQGGLTSFGGTVFTELDYTVPTIKRISIVEDDIEKFACCYAENMNEDTFSHYEPYAHCREWFRKYYVFAGPLKSSRKYIFKVADQELDFFVAAFEEYDDMSGSYLSNWPDEYDYILDYRGDETVPLKICNVDEDMLKYYNMDGDPTGIMCGRVNTAHLDNRYDDSVGDIINEVCQRFLYNYIQVAEESLTVTTEFIPDDPDENTHIIANVAGIDDDVRFDGKVFLGRIVLEDEEETVKIY